ncbi:flagellar associated protein [Thecamonas trahens ATCC 50062]|uniref:Flagellar associated protein n=1 Tax=Thecamonas trahens ATCC 50062 TaxID=461836 RepID=A0A0L0DXL4_THETB|nr:flagellar associated protein [Thecamonas trahens ATCC 50062]KNC56278.1 flagellar associated protein [Thecamonas trahens ATCC 50062]|eukprot:XP_013760797.1 flagellar associated protein [Thecamonas trahens ATCC 50062]
MKLPYKSELLAEAEEIYEEATFKGRVYRRLGAAPATSRGAKLPQAVRNPEYRFGIASDSSMSAKELIQPSDGENVEETDPRIVEMYKKSHRAYAPGEQVRTGLSMRNIDPATHRFGARAERSYNEGGVAGVLTWTNDVEGGDHTAVLVPKHMAELHAKTQPRVGVSRSRALLATGEVPDKAFGTVSRTDSIGAGELIHNSLPSELLAEDPSLGRPEVPKGRPRGTGRVDRDRVYGVPSIRSDVPPPGVRKLDDRQNYGDEKGAWELLNPSPYHTIGVTEDDFLTPLPKAELRDIVSGAGIDLTPAVFDSVHTAAAALDPNGLVSIETFRNVLDEFRARGMA